MKFVVSKKMSLNYWNLDFKRRRKKNIQLLEEFKKKIFSFKIIEGGDKKIKFYIGFLNFKIFYVVFLEIFLKVKRKKIKLLKEDELLLIFVKLR